VFFDFYLFFKVLYGNLFQGKNRLLKRFFLTSKKVQKSTASFFKIYFDCHN